MPQLLSTVVKLVDRGFYQLCFDYFYRTASSKTYPMFQYLTSAVGLYAWPNQIFTDQYLFHEILHNYAMEVINQRKLTPILIQIYDQLHNDTVFQYECQLYLKYPVPITPEYEYKWINVDRPNMIGLVLTHIHVYAAVTATYVYLGEGNTTLKTIRDFECHNANPHPSYVYAWNWVTNIQNNTIAMQAVLNELNHSTN